MKKATVYYFPYAGASTATFRSWNKEFSEDVELKVIDYPGHGKRSKEKFLDSSEDLCKDIYSIVKQEQSGGEGDYYLAGHCLGALVSFRVCQMIEKEKQIRLPRRIFISGHGAPDKVVYEGLYKMNDEDLLAYQKKVGLIPSELFEDDYIDYVKMMLLPIIRHDSMAYESFKAEPYPVSVPITAINGLKDWKSPQDEVTRWEQFTTDEVKFVNYDEEHFFVSSMTDIYLAEINNTVIEESGLN